MDEQLFNKCTTKLLQIEESAQNIIENILNDNESGLLEIKEALELLQETINGL